ncbi:HAD family hydrolase [Meridianimarinicoccus aquatilis]|uniref:Haloacid dehalogenase-like hydrolase n=1 Tax=Meridianimarinicoccus aquatilis TaxID=2552766 RepID=A0A4R6B4N1_9RHOB|nr:HAD family hydrolase [Fluviibacterium aquatile]QIE43796.1 haloacid dehalogenase-like hydrolase [Rhodobacteraceae bacterium SC52]TDL90458.1 haloacid dehalogenase-like hydrolase [Fluviibacterium aquatile]
MRTRLLSAASLLCFATLPAFADPLPSWNDTDTKSRIIAFVDATTDTASDDYVTPADRIAVFDNDGTLWAEQPVYFQLLYAMDRVARMAEDDPSILTSDVLKAAANGDLEGALANGEDGLIEIVVTSHSGLSVSAFEQDVSDWLETAVHPQTGAPIIGMVYQPMLELLSYLRDEGFATYIVSGGGIHFMRAFAEDVYGIPPQQVIGSAGKSSYAVIDGVPTIMKDPGIAFVDDKEGKPIGIDTKIGKRPILVGGNSDGDFEMLEWATAGDGPRLGMIVHHTDADREWAYDRDSHIGSLSRGLDESDARGWLLIDMAGDWANIWP